MPSKDVIPGTQAVTRAIALLKAFSDQDPELTLTELAQRASLNKTTAYRLLTALEREGLVARRDPGEAYRLGPEMISLGGRALRANDLRSASRACLERLAKQSGETATLEVLDGRQVLILDEVLSTHLVGTSQSIGTRWPAHATSTGKILLAFLAEGERRELLKAPLVRMTENTLTDLGRLERQLVRVRAQGYATAVEEIEVGFVAVGAPVRDHSGETIAAISLGGPSARLTLDRLPGLGAQVADAARDISAALGFRPQENAPDEFKR
jgi:IclR family acetate operon transcriptional repressor